MVTISINVVRCIYYQKVILRFQDKIRIMEKYFSEFETRRERPLIRSNKTKVKIGGLILRQGVYN